MVLQVIRERLSGILAFFIFGILIIPFALVGVNSYFTTTAPNAVAKVNDFEITESDFSQGFQNYRRRMQSLMGESFDPEYFDQPVIRRQFLDSLIDQELIAQVSEQSGLTVADEDLAKAIREIEAFQVDGVFNADVYQSRLLADGSSTQEFESRMRSQLLLGQFPNAITSSAIATDTELARFVAVEDQQRSFKALVITADSAAAPEAAAGDTDAEPAADSGAVEPAEEVIQAWYDNHPELFRSPEQVVIEYIELDASAMEDDSAPGDELLRDRFEEQKSRFVTPEGRLASHILIEIPEGADDTAVETARQAAAELAKRANAGEDFAALAREFSKDAGSATVGGDLGWVEPGFMVQAFEEGLFALSVDAPISDPVRTSFGWHVIQLRDIRAAEGMSFEEARETLLAEFTQESQERRFIEQADRLVDLVYEDPTTLSTAADELGLQVQQAGPFGRAGGEGIAATPAVVAAAFSDLVLEQASASDPVELGENHVVVVRLKEHKPEGMLPLADVRDRVITGVRRDEAMELAAAKAQSLKERVEGGADLLTLAEEGKVTVIEADSVLRSSAEQPADLLREVFRMQRPEGDTPRIARVSLANGYAVLVLESVADGQLKEDDLIRRQQYKERIAGATAGAEAFGFLRQLRKQSKIEVFEDRL
jgi:peptidyl-prolyl cis-trans isomerase D